MDASHKKVESRKKWQETNNENEEQKKRTARVKNAKMLEIKEKTNIFPAIFTRVVIIFSA